MTADADQDGAEVTLICDGSVWNPAGGGAAKNLAQFTTTNTTLDINQASAVAIPWNSQLYLDSGYTHSIVTNPERISFDSAGTYLVSVTLAFGGTALRANPGVKFRLNGSAVLEGQAMSGYIRNLTGHDEASSTLTRMVDAAAGDYLEVITQLMGGTGTVNLRANESVLFIEQLSSVVPLTESLQLNELTDVDTAGVADGEVLMYSAGASGWVPNAAGGGGGVFELNTGVVRNTGDHSTEDFVFGSPQLADDGNTAHDNRMYFDKSKGAFRAGRVTGTEWDDANVGSYSTAMGSGTIASGSYSIAIGLSNTASGANSAAMGFSNTASGLNSAVIGRFNTASSDYSTAIGYSNTSSGYASAAIGRNNTASGDDSIALGRAVNVTATGHGSAGIGLTTASPATDPQVSGTQSFGIFMGNHSGVNLASANTMLVAGGSLIIDPAVPATNLAADTALEIEGTIKIAYGGEACDANREGAIYYNSGDDKFYACATAGSWGELGGGGTPAGADREIQFNSGSAFGAINTFKLMADGDLLLTGTYTGTASVPVTGAGTRMFFDTQKAAFRAGNVGSTQWDNTNIGNYSIGLGQNTIASGSYAVAIGDGPTASGVDSIAMGGLAKATASNSTAIGAFSEANAVGSSAFGYVAKAGGDYSVAFGREVEITATGDGSMAMGLTTTSPATDPKVSGAQSFGIFMGDQSGVDVTQANAMVLMGGSFGIGDTTPDVALDVVGDIEYTGVLTAVSDIRFKYNIEPLDNPLAKLTSLHGLSYDKKSNNDSEVTEYGFAAQEVQEVFPELVRTASDEMGTLSVNYIGLIAPMVEAMKVQQAQIRALEERNEMLLRRLEALEGGGGD
jgi:hypothetical protein